MKKISLISVLVLINLIIFTNDLLGITRDNSNTLKDSYGWTDEGEFKSLKIDDDGIYSIRFSNDGSKLFVVNKDFKGYKIFDTETGHLLKEKKFEIEDVVFSEFSDDDSAIVFWIFNTHDGPIEHRVYSLSIDSLLIHSIHREYLFHCSPIIAQHKYPYGGLQRSHYSIKDNTLLASIAFQTNCYGSSTDSRMVSGRLIKATVKGDSTITTVVVRSPTKDFITTDGNEIICVNYYEFYSKVNLFYDYKTTRDFTNSLVVLNPESNNSLTLFENSIHWETGDDPLEPFHMINYIKHLKGRNAFLTIYNDGSFKIWNLNDYSTLDSFNLPKNYYTYAVYPSGKNIIGIVNHNINIYSIPNFRLIDSIAFPKEVDIRGSLAVSPDGESFVCGSLDGTVRLFYRDVIASFEDNQSITNSNCISIFPNPASDFINISIDSEAFLHSREVQILNLLGLVVSKSELIDGNNRIDISHLPRGTYFIKVGDKVEKFVKM